MRPVLLKPPESRWQCPNCDLEHVTRTREPHTPYHTCGGLRGLSAPFIPAGTKAKVAATERGDYVGTELVQTDRNGRPVMNIITERDEGLDCAVLAPCAQADRD